MTKDISKCYDDLVNLVANHSHCLSAEPVVIALDQGRLSSTKTNQHQPVNEMFVQVDGAHHAPVDVAISACDWGGVRLEEHHHHYCHCHCHCYWG